MGGLANGHLGYPLFCIPRGQRQINTWLACRQVWSLSTWSSKERKPSCKGTWAFKLTPQEIAGRIKGLLGYYYPPLPLNNPFINKALFLGGGALGGGGSLDSHDIR